MSVGRKDGFGVKNRRTAVGTDGEEGPDPKPVPSDRYRAARLIG